MLIDWFTVGAQVLNFIILVWLLKRFLYQPVQDAIAAREKKIAAELADAAAAKAEAHQQREALQGKNQALDEERAGLLREAKAAAKAEGARLLAAARDAADAASAQRAKALRNEAQELDAEMVRHARQQVFVIARQVLRDLAAASLEVRACEVFVERLRALEGPSLATLRVALLAATAADPALLRSAFELPAAQQAAIQAALAASLGDQGSGTIALRFETDAELVNGIELRVHGQKLGWSVAHYLDALTTGLEAQVHAQAAA